jgi:hypothetical protein
MKAQTNVTVQDQDGNSTKPLLQAGFLTVSNLRKACENYSYILLINLNGDLLGINTKVSKIASKRKKYHGNQRTRFIGFMLCDFQTYISYKGGFV